MNTNIKSENTGISIYTLKKNTKRKIPSLLSLSLPPFLPYTFLSPSLSSNPPPLSLSLSHTLLSLLRLASIFSMSLSPSSQIYLLPISFYSFYHLSTALVSLNFCFFAPSPRHACFCLLSQSHFSSFFLSLCCPVHFSKKIFSLYFRCFFQAL